MEYCRIPVSKIWQKRKTCWYLISARLLIPSPIADSSISFNTTSCRKNQQLDWIMAVLAITASRPWWFSIQIFTSPPWRPPRHCTGSPVWKWHWCQGITTYHCQTLRRRLPTLQNHLLRRRWNTTRTGLRQHGRMVKKPGWWGLMLANAICSKLPDSGITYLPNTVSTGSSFRKSNTILTFVLNLLQTWPRGHTAGT